MSAFEHDWRTAEMSPPLFLIGPGEVAWILLAAASGIMMYWVLTLHQKIEKLQSRLAHQSRSISFVDEWINEIDTRLSVIQSLIQTDNEDREPDALPTRPFLESIVGNSDANGNIDTAMVQEIIAGLRKRKSDYD